MSAVTQLFFMHEKPVHAGVYKLARIDGDPRIFARWIADTWCEPCATVDEAALSWVPAWVIQKATDKIIGWRGLADKHLLPSGLVLQLENAVAILASNAAEAFYAQGHK